MDQTNLISKSELCAKDIKFCLFKKKEPSTKVLLSERKLAQYYNVSRNTIRAALQSLIDENILSIVNGNYKLSELALDHNTRDILKLPCMKETFFHILEQKQIEANKVLSGLFNVPLGTLISVVTYYTSTRFDEVIPYEISRLYFLDKSISLVNSKYSAISPLQLVVQRLNFELKKEEQTLKLGKPNDEACFYLQIKKDDDIINRHSTFTDTQNQKIILNTQTIPKYFTITANNKQIYEKVGGFIE